MEDFSPDKIYLHDPCGSFQDESLNYFETVTWCEDKIEEDDIEYVKVRKKDGNKKKKQMTDKELAYKLYNMKLGEKIELDNLGVYTRVIDGWVLNNNMKSIKVINIKDIINKDRSKEKLFDDHKNNDIKSEDVLKNIQRLPLQYISEQIDTFVDIYGEQPKIIIFNDILKNTYSGISELLGIKIIFSRSMEKIELMRLY